MSILITIIAFLIIFSFLIIIHEIGHFTAAKRSGIKVEEFGFGLPPRIWGKKKGETIYSINWIPFGGFVRLYGESPKGKKEYSSKRSFVGKPLRTRVKVVVAGVLLNFLLAIILLTFGFAYGMEPLIVDTDDVLANIKNGNITYERGVIVDNVKEGSLGEMIGIESGDEILELNSVPVGESFELLSYLSGERQELFTLKIKNEKEVYEVDVDASLGDEPGIEINPVLFIPRVQIYDIKANSKSYNAGLRNGDYILKVNDDEIFRVSEYLEYLNNNNELKYTVMRGENVMDMDVKLPVYYNILINSVFVDSIAEEVGVENNDIVYKLNGKDVESPQELRNLIVENQSKGFELTVQRDGVFYDIAVPAFEDEFLGVSMTTLKPYENNELSVYDSELITSLIEVKDVKTGLLEAPVEALKETGRLSKLTAIMFMGVIKSFVSKFTIPDGIAGPVGIVELTHIFVQEGAMATLRFVALLSLSLAVINILPIPGLDGGRLLFLIVEGIIGRRLDPKYEAYIHSLGMIFLLGLILFVTYKDLLRIFS